jgi:hypothetical protein
MSTESTLDLIVTCSTKQVNDNICPRENIYDLFCGIQTGSLQHYCFIGYGHSVGGRRSRVRLCKPSRVSSLSFATPPVRSAYGGLRALEEWWTTAPRRREVFLLCLGYFSLSSSRWLSKYNILKSE